MGSLYLYSFIGLVNDVPSERFPINSIPYCSLGSARHWNMGTQPSCDFPGMGRGQRKASGAA